MMTVADLRTALSALPNDMRVIVASCAGGFDDVARIEELGIDLASANRNLDAGPYIYASYSQAEIAALIRSEEDG